MVGWRLFMAKTSFPSLCYAMLLNLVTWETWGYFTRDSRFEKNTKFADQKAESLLIYRFLQTKQKLGVWSGKIRQVWKRHGHSQHRQLRGHWYSLARLFRTPCILGRIWRVGLVNWFPSGERCSNLPESFGAVFLGKQDREDRRDGEYAGLVTELPAAISIERGYISEGVGLWERWVACRSRVLAAVRGFGAFGPLRSSCSSKPRCYRSER